MGTLDNAIRNLASRINLSGGALAAWDRYQRYDPGLRNAVEVAIEDGLPASYVSRSLFQLVGSLANAPDTITLSMLAVAPATPALTLRQAEDLVDARAAWTAYLEETQGSTSPAALRRAEEFVDAQVTAEASGTPLLPPAPPPARNAASSTATTAPATTPSTGGGGPPGAFGGLGAFESFQEESSGIGGALAVGAVVILVLVGVYLAFRRG